MRALILAVAIALAGPAWALPANTWVLAVGNDQGDPDDVRLLYAEADADAVIEVLRDLGGVHSDRITKLVGEGPDTVRKALGAVARAVAAEAGDGPSAVVVYYSGHADARALHLGGAHLPLRELVDTVRAIPAKTRLLVLDACRSGGATRVKGVQATQSFDLDLTEPGAVEGLAVITSSTARESSLESDRLRGSFFTHYLVGGLRGAADHDGDGAITLDEAYRYAYAQTVRASGQTHNLQHPTFNMDMKGRGALVLARADGGRQRLGRLALGEPAIYLVNDADGRLVAELQPERAGAHVALPARRYVVQHRRPREYLAYDVELKPGGTVRLADLPHTATRYDRLVRKGGGDRQTVHGFGVLVAGRGEVVEGEGFAPHLVLEYGVDTPWLTPTLRLRGAQYDVDGDLARTHRELGLGLTLQRFVDLSWLSVAFGVTAEAAWHQHQYRGADAPADRAAWAGSFGVLLAAERVLYEGLSFRVEGGPLATVLRGSRVDRGAEVEEALETEASVWAGAGFRLRL